MGIDGIMTPSMPHDYMEAHAHTQNITARNGRKEKPPDKVRIGLPTIALQ